MFKRNRFILVILISFVTLTSFVQGQKVTLQIQVLYDRETAYPVSKATIFFSDGQMITTNTKGMASRKYVLADSTLLVKISKIIIGNDESKLVNSRRLQYILLDESQKKVTVMAYILDHAAWTARESKVQKVTDDQYEKFETEFSSIPAAAINPMMLERIKDITRYKPILVSNIASTVYSELTESGKKAFNLALESNENLWQATSLLEEIVDEKTEVTEDMLLLARLSVLAFNRMAGYYYLQSTPSDAGMLSNLMEYKEMAIMLSQSGQLEPQLKKVLMFVKDPEFQATNRNDLASLYQNQEDYESAITEARIALDHYKTLEAIEPARYQLLTTAVMFNLGNAYMKLEQNEDALAMFQAVLQKIGDMDDGRPELQSMDFYANKFIANIIEESKGLKEAYPYYYKIFTELRKSPEIALTLPREILFGDYLHYCEGKELMDAPEDEVTDCYEESIKLLDNAYDSERKTLGRTVVYHQLAKILEEKGDYEKALAYYQRSLNELEQHETDVTKGLRIELYNCMGELLDEYGRDQEALDYFHQSIQLAQISANTGDTKSLRHLAESWYKIGQYYFKRVNGDSAYFAFNKTIDFLTDPNADQQENVSLLANAYNMKGATLAEILNDNHGSEENFRKSVELYQQLMGTDPDTYMMEYASSANNLLAIQAQHAETIDKVAALALIDSVMRAYRIHPVHSVKAEEIMANMNRYTLLFSGNMMLIQNNLKEVGELRNQRQQIEGQVGKSAIQSRIVSKLEESYHLVDSTMKVRLGPILAQELGNLSWYAIFDHNYELAESSARQALAIDSNQTWVNTNLAHSLILVGKIDEGKAIYDQYKNVKHSDGRLMREVFLADIEELVNAGITHQAWEEVKSILNK